MSEIRNDAPTGRREIVEHREVVERSVGPERDPVRQSGPNLNWLLLTVLLLVVVALTWFIFSRGEPQRPLDNVQINVPTVEVPTVREERRIEVQVPASGGQAPAQPPGQP